MSAHHYPCQIIIAWVEDSAEPIPDPNRRTDLGEAPRLRPVRIAKAARWLNEGIAVDVEAAQRYAAREGRAVFCYGMDVEDAMGAARADVMRGGVDRDEKEERGLT